MCVVWPTAVPFVTPPMERLIVSSGSSAASFVTLNVRFFVVEPSAGKTTVYGPAVKSVPAVAVPPPATLTVTELDTFASTYGAPDRVIRIAALADSGAADEARVKSTSASSANRRR